MRWRKIDEAGNYLRFPGLTVVSNLKQADLAWAKRIYDAINQTPELKEHYSPLPYDSYHLTTTDLYTESQLGEQWEEFIAIHQPFFLSLSQKLANDAVDISISKIQYLITENVLQLVVELPKEQVEYINSTAAYYGIQSKVPRYFHITLAYMVKLPGSDAEKKLLTQKALNTLAPILDQCPAPFVLSPPKLCFFNDMTKFISWNGENAPFDVPKQPSVSNSQYTMFAATEVVNETRPENASPTFGKSD